MRSCYVGQVSLEHLDKQVTLFGWVHRRRDHGGVIFIDLRDREGLAQVVCDPDREECFATAGLNKDELVAFLAARSRQFTRDQKVGLLKALMSVFVADGKFDETEHAALMEYTAAIGFETRAVWVRRCE